MQKGLIHIYCGDGKGKTTAGMGLCLRAAGRGMKVLIYQFMKDNTTGERQSLAHVPNITMIEGLPSEKFSSQMSEDEKMQRINYYEERFREVTALAISEKYDILFLDEVIYTIRAGLFSEELLLTFLKAKPKGLEVILTGQGPDEALMAAADYVSEICKRKHPFDAGIAAREGIER